MGLICGGHYCPIVRNVCGHCEENMTTTAHTSGHGMNISFGPFSCYHQLSSFSQNYLSRVWLIAFLLLQGGSNESSAVLHTAYHWLSGSYINCSHNRDLPTNIFTITHNHTNWFKCKTTLATFFHLGEMDLDVPDNCLQPSVHCQNWREETGLQLRQSPSVFQR